MTHLSRCLLLLLICFALSLHTLKEANANAVGADVQNFNPTTSGLDFVTVQSSETLRPGFFNIGFFLNEAWNSLPRFEGQPPFSDRILGSDLSLGMGLLKNWDLGVSVPSVVAQSVSAQPGFGGQYGQTGIKEVKLNTKFRFVGNGNGGLAAVFSTNFNLTRNNPYLGADAGPIYNLELALDHTFGKVAGAINFGHRWRTRGTQIPGIPIQPFGDQWIASLGANYLFSRWDTKLIAELVGNFPASGDTGITDREASSLEALLGLKHDFTDSIAGHIGAGRGIVSGLSSPDLRIYTGINIQIGPVFALGKPTLEQLRSEEFVRQNLKKKKVVRFVAHNLTFEFDSADLTQESIPLLEDVAAQLTGVDFEKLTIEGHTDSIGPDEYNLKLSQARANSIKHELMEHHHIPSEKIVAIGYGETRPVADNGNKQGRQLNRRVEFEIQGGGE